MASLPRQPHVWTPEENSLLRDLVLTHTNKQLSHKLNQSVYSVIRKIKELGLQRPSKTWTPERFVSVITKQEDGCWIWPGTPDSRGYGNFRYQGKTWRAHVFSYVIVSGYTVTKEHLHHKCENKLCVNPDHLQDLTNSEHSSITFAAIRERTHCSRGHEFTADNVYRRQREPNWRYCRQCARDRYRALRPKTTRKKVSRACLICDDLFESYDGTICSDSCKWLKRIHGIEGGRRQKAVLRHIDTMLNSGYRKCSKCKEYLLASEFGGPTRRCKECAREYGRDLYHRRMRRLHED